MFHLFLFSTAATFEFIYFVYLLHLLRFSSYFSFCLFVFMLVGCFVVVFWCLKFIIRLAIAERKKEFFLLHEMTGEMI